MKVSAAIVLVAVTMGHFQERELEPGEGREIVIAACTGCHNTDIIVSAHMGRKSWDATLTWMQETQGLAPLVPEVRKIILDYLEKTQGLADDEAEGTSSPWAYPLYRPNPLW
jgi:hypothetical protein